MNEQGQSLLAIIDEVIDLVSRAKSLPMSASVMVNRSEILDLLESARDIVPEELAGADEALNKANEVLEESRRRGESAQSEAQEQARTILAAAREQASRMVAQDKITVAAKSQASRILDEAKASAAQIKRGADEYAAQVLDELAGELETNLNQILAGRAHLANRLEGN